MNAKLLERSTTAAAAIGGAMDVMASILNPAVQLALWQRERPARLAWIDALEWDAIDDIDARIVGPNFGAEIERLLCEAGYPQTAQGHSLRDEIDILATRFAQIFDTPHLRMRLEVVQTDACRKFHMDHVTARLLMPLSGPGTQWIDQDDGGSEAIRELDCGNVGIFKGRLSVDEPRVLHRSPPIAASGETRLLLAINPASADGVS